MALTATNEDIIQQLDKNLIYFRSLVIAIRDLHPDEYQDDPIPNLVKMTLENLKSHKELIDIIKNRLESAV